MSALVEVLEGQRAWHVERGNALRVLTTLPDSSIDAVIADHPYALGGLHMRDRARSPLQKYLKRSASRYIDFEGDQCDQYAFLARTVAWLLECHRAMKLGAVVGVFADWRQAPITSLALQVAGFRWRGTVSWDKTAAVRPQPGGFRAQAEFLQWGTKGAITWRGSGTCRPGAFTVPVRPKEKRHATGKPIDLMRQLVRVCRPGGVVLDPFAGSGSTGVGCLMEGYRFLGIEIVDEYADIAIERLRTTAGEASTNASR